LVLLGVVANGFSSAEISAAETRKELSLDRIIVQTLKDATFVRKTVAIYVTQKQPRASYAENGAANEAEIQNCPGISSTKAADRFIHLWANAIPHPFLREVAKSHVPNT
jgi:hypothetical protein